MSLAFHRIAKCGRKYQIYKSMGIQLCDVSLRDGLQTEKVADWSTQKKKEHCLETMNRPESIAKIEVGSLVSPRIYPIMSDTNEIHEWAKHINDLKEGNTEPFVLVPSFGKLHHAVELGYEHISFISSVSDAFQKKNTGVSVDQNIIDLKMARKFLDIYAPQTRTKLYLSCITECPIAGQLSKHEIVFNCVKHMSLEFDEICLSDTCGTMTSSEFAEIVENMAFVGYPVKQISVHLHADETNAREVEGILHYCFMRGIRMFDVSGLSGGGCSRTIAAGKTKPNLTYDMFFGTLEKYIK